MAERISRDDVAHVAVLARLALADDELETFTEQLASVLDHAADVEALDVADVPTTAHPVALANVMRDDVPAPTLNRDAVLSEAPASDAGQFRVPPILGEAP
jgi:aspartyl-tRNA(Asn)/glutamyl-tRNA(Gln) amidotransferase subunit C